jgi:hypothetical protein
MTMIHAVLAVGLPHGAASSGSTATHWLAIGILIGILAVFFAPAWLLTFVIIFDLVALGWTFGILNYAHSAHGRWVWVAVPFLLFGLWYGATRGLKMLSEHEFLTRRSGMKARGMWMR